jgi:hypothetical protein
MVLTTACALAVFLISQEPPKSKAGRDEALRLPGISLFYMMEDARISDLLAVTDEEKANLALARQAAEERIGPRPPDTPGRIDWLAKYVDEEATGQVAELIAEMLGKDRTAKLRKYRREAYGVFSPELLEELNPTDSQRRALLGAVLAEEEKLPAPASVSTKNYAVTVVRTLEARHRSETPKFAKVLDVDRQWTLAKAAQWPLRQARDVKAPFRSDYQSIVRLLLIGSLRSHLSLSPGKAQAVDDAILAWRDKNERAYIEAEKGWTPFKARELYDRLVEHDKELKPKLEKILSDDDRKRLAQVVIQCKGVAFAFSSEGAKLLGISKRQMDEAREAFVEDIRSGRKRDPVQLIDDLHNHSEWDRNFHWKFLTPAQKARWTELVGEPLPPKVRVDCARAFTALGMQW